MKIPMVLQFSEIENKNFFSVVEVLILYINTQKHLIDLLLCPTVLQK